MRSENILWNLGGEGKSRLRPVSRAEQFGGRMQLAAAKQYQVEMDPLAD
jgi:hypothetical protein